MNSTHVYGALGIDIGGTFTDVVITTSDGALHRAKTLTTPRDPVDGVVTGVQRALDHSGLAAESVTRLVHGTTLATNIILERTGVRVAFVTTAGFRNLLCLGHYARVEEERYDLLFAPPEPPLPLSHCFDVPERLAANGEVIEALDERAAVDVARRIAALGVESVAICFLHSYANPAHEQRMAEICARELPGVVVVASSSTWREIREYERASTTVVSAYVGPVMSAYLARLESAMHGLGIPARLQIMESSGGVMTADQAARRAVYTIESGPAAGVIAAVHIGRNSGRNDLISFDMGGTTAKAGVVRDGQPDITHEFNVGGKASTRGHRSSSGIPIKAPAIDLAEVGSGGGSIAWIDEGGALRVGPRSAGAEPGPACYARGGTEPTVTDANLVLGYLDPTSFAQGTMTLDHARSVDAIDKHIAIPLGLDTAAAAHAIHEIVNSNMSGAVDVVTVQRGVDPRDLAIVGFGGAGPMHVARIAEEFGISTVLVPTGSGVASAIGLLATDLSVDRAQTVLVAAADVDVEHLNGTFDALTAEAASELAVTLGAPDVSVRRSVDVRYLGQAHEITVPAPARMAGTADVDEIVGAFFAKYEQSYGIELAAATEIVNVRATVTRHVPHLAIAADVALSAGNANIGTRRAYFAEHGGFVDVKVFRRELLAIGEPVEGPAIVQEPEATLVVPPRWTSILDPFGNLVLEHTGASA
ncbi:MAG: hypothetical protein JWL83_3960 [Actinomycetia bacterium]|nr:hypothetical protein [Actinomycetes bacterium]